MLTRIAEFLFGGTRSFNDAEARLLSFLVDALPTRDREILLCQINSVGKVQRQHPGRLVAAYYKPGREVPRLPYPGDEYCLANVTYKSGARTRTTSLVLHDGRFMSFERSVPRSLSEISSLVAVVLHPGGFKTVARDIDGEEHGRDCDPRAAS